MHILKLLTLYLLTAKTIDRLIAECASLSGKVREGKKLTVADFPKVVSHI